MAPSRRGAEPAQPPTRAAAGAQVAGDGGAGTGTESGGGSLWGEYDEEAERAAFQVRLAGIAVCCIFL
jgi:hypothetical protein